MSWLVLLLLAAETPPHRFESNIAAFESRDREQPPEPGGILFLGSSTIVGWKLDEHLPELSALNRGFGGSTIPDSLHFFERVVVPYRPRLIVFYAGDNDIAGGADAAMVVADFRTLVDRLHDAVPGCRLAFLGIKPSLKRWAMWPTMTRANAGVAAICRRDVHLRYVDTAAATLGADGRPRGELFREDGLHLNEAGYAAWSAVVREQLADWLSAEPPAPHRLGRRPRPGTHST